MENIMDERTALGTGAWQQAHEGTTTYVKVIVPGGSYGLQLDLITSETDGPGKGESTVNEERIRETTSVQMPSGSYYINAIIRSNPEDKKITITTQTVMPS